MIERINKLTKKKTRNVRDLHRYRNNVSAFTWEKYFKLVYHQLGEHKYHAAFLSIVRMSH